MAAALMMLAALAAAPVPEERAIGSSVSYVFASELGSGVYDLDGRTLQVYSIPLSYELRPRSTEHAGLRAIMPVTFGFFDFDPRDIPSSGLPESIDSLSIMPGLELEYELTPRWVLLPYARFGASFASSDVDAVLAAAGVRSDYRRPVGSWDLLVSNEISAAGADFRGDAADDVYARLRNAAEVRRATRWQVRQRVVDLGLYAVADYITDPPDVPLAGGAESEPVQLEAGVMFGTRPEWRIRRVPIPRIGLGYRLAGDLSGWRFVIGSPF